MLLVTGETKTESSRFKNIEREHHLPRGICDFASDSSSSSRYDVDLLQKRE
jgi:hypothetical protein